MPIGIRNDELLDMLQGEFQRRYEPNFAWGNAISAFSLLPGLRGLWPMSSVDENGNALDLSGKGLTLAYAGNPGYNYQGLAPYIDLDGVGDSLSRNDEAALDIIGTEGFIASAKRGLTIGGWFWFDTLVTARLIMSKWKVTGSNDRSYRLYWSQVNNAFTFDISTDGIATVFAASTAGYSTGRWYWIVGRFTPSTEVAIFINRVKTTNLVGVPASLFNSISTFYIGTQDAGATFMMDGRVSICFLSSALLSDTIINTAYEQTRALYGVK